jgi:hypothetical protein
LRQPIDKRKNPGRFAMRRRWNILHAFGVEAFDLVQGTDPSPDASQNINLTKDPDSTSRGPPLVNRSPNLPLLIFRVKDVDSREVRLPAPASNGVEAGPCEWYIVLGAGLVPSLPHLGRRGFRVYGLGFLPHLGRREVVRGECRLGGSHDFQHLDVVRGYMRIEAYTHTIQAYTNANTNTHMHIYIYIYIYIYMHAYIYMQACMHVSRRTP